MDEWRSIPDLDDTLRASVEARTQELGHFLFEHLEEEQPSVFQRRWWDEQLMSLAMQDEGLKVQLFRFVDVLPMLATPQAVVGHLQEYLHEVRGQLPGTLRAALGIGRRTALTRSAIARLARLAAMDMARRFIAGTTAAEVIASALRERDKDRAFTLDILGEAVTSDTEAEAFFRSYVDLIERVAPTVNAWPDRSLVDGPVPGSIPRFNLSIKLSALDSHFDAIDPAGVLDRAGGRLRELLRVAQRYGAFIHVDMESYDKKDVTIAVFRHVLSEPEFRDRADVGIVIQCYLKDAARDLHELADWAERRGAPIWVRLVKGAYWDYETIHARATGWPVPCFEQKWQSDANFERATRFLMSRHASIRPALGSHNIRSLAHGLAVAEALGVPREAYELQMLYGMADAEKQVLVRLGHRLRIYMPYGELIPGMAYLVRRLLENTSNNSFLRAGFVEHLDRARLLAAPGGKMAVTSSESGAAKMPVESDSRPSPWPPFANEPPVDFARETSRTRMEAALADVRRHMGKHFPLVIGGQRVDTGSRMSSFDPSLKSRLVGTVAAAERPHVDAAVRAALQAQPDWARRGANRRGEMLRRMATILRQRHFELAAWQIYECGKGWREATNDVCEAIDFCEYYARGAVELERPRGVHLPGEENQFEYVPRGVVATIAPWNFPLAILTGMTAAALATGNTVVMKPAEQSALVGALLMEVAEQAGIPDGVLNFLPGAGEVVGAALVEHPDVAVIAFTGSRAVGLAINARAAEVSGGQAPLVKRVIAEMGGKNCIIVDEDADLDEAVLGVIRSAFGYQGQKCSACSRVVVLPGVHDAFLRRLVDAARSLRVGPADSPATDVSPVINEEAWTRIHEFVSVGREEGKQVLAADVGTLAEQGYFVGPHIFVDVSPQARIAQEEIFGPVLALIRASDLDEAIRIANGTPYALTGGIYSRNPAHVERAKRELMVGNLYINRPITGALVGRQPFGGFKMSGIGSQAGGPDYLLQFVLPRTISENTMRRGFAPETDSAAPASGRLEPPSN